MTAKKTTIVLPEIRIGHMKLRIVGDSLLCVHKFSEKSKQQMLKTQMGEAKQGREPKNPTELFIQALHIMPGCTPVVHGEFPGEVWAEGEFGFRACAMKAAIIRAANDCGLRMTDMRRALRIPGIASGEEFGSMSLIPIICNPGPYLRMDTVRLESGVADIRFRPEFREWEAEVDIRFNKAVLTMQQVINLVRTAGFGVGLNEWRPEKGGEWGTFAVDLKSVEVLEDDIWD